MFLIFNFPFLQYNKKIRKHAQLFFFPSEASVQPSFPAFGIFTHQYNKKTNTRTKIKHKNNHFFCIIPETTCLSSYYNHHISILHSASILGILTFGRQVGSWSGVRGIRGEVGSTAVRGEGQGRDWRGEVGRCQGKGRCRECSSKVGAGYRSGLAWNGSAGKSGQARDSIQGLGRSWRGNKNWTNLASGF